MRSDLAACRKTEEHSHDRFIKNLLGRNDESESVFELTDAERNTQECALRAAENDRIRFQQEMDRVLLVSSNRAAEGFRKSESRRHHAKYANDLCQRAGGCDMQAYYR